MYGVELAATLPFGEFIPALDGFGITGGVSYTKSKIHIYRRSAPTRPARAIRNGWRTAPLYFEKWGFSARGSVRYRSSFQGEVSGFAAEQRLPPRQAGDDCRWSGRL